MIPLSITPDKLFKIFKMKKLQNTPKNKTATPPIQTESIESKVVQLPQAQFIAADRYEAQPDVVLGLHPETRNLLRELKDGISDIDKKIAELKKQKEMKEHAVAVVMILEVRKAGIDSDASKKYQLHDECLNISVPQPPILVLRKEEE